MKYFLVIFDLILYSKRTLEDLKKVNEPGVNKNLTLRMRLKNGEELIIVQQNEFYLISKQICKIVDVLLVFVIEKVQSANRDR